MNRNELRTKLIGQKHKPVRKLVKLFGCEIELQQPTLGAIMDAQQDGDEKSRTADVFIRYAYVPGTDEKVFEAGDKEAILNWPFSEELIEVQRAIVSLTGIDIGAAEEDINSSPLSDT